MSFGFYDKNNNIKQLNIEIGKNWKEINDTCRKELDCIFNFADLNANSIIDENEAMMLKSIFEYADSGKEETKNNKILENDELEFLNNLIENGKLDTKEKFFTEKEFNFKNDIKIQNSHQDGTKNWSEGINRNISLIQLKSGTDKNLKDFMNNVGKEQGFNVEEIPAPAQWLEDYAVLRADKKQLIPNYPEDFSTKTTEARNKGDIDINNSFELFSNTQGAAASNNRAGIYALGLAEKDKVFGKSYLEGGNVLNTLDKNGKPSAVIGEDSIQYTILAMGMTNSEESREIAKKQIAQDLGIKQDNVTYIPQYDFHIDMAYRPLNNGQMGIPDYEEGVSVIKKILEDKGIDISKLEDDIDFYYDMYDDGYTKNETLKFIELFDDLNTLAQDTKNTRENAEKTLKNNGYDIVKIPCFSTINNETVNYSNGICGTSKKTGDKFYITNTSGIEILDSYMEKFFKQIGFDKIYFAPTSNHLKQSGGIDCLTKEY